MIKYVGAFVIIVNILLLVLKWYETDEEQASGILGWLTALFLYLFD